MKVLLDTHILLWWLADDEALPREARMAIADPATAVVVSAVSIAEISIKRGVGKLDAPWIPDALLAENGIDTLPFTSAHAGRLLELPMHHRDPFDRMLIAQALHEGLVLVSVDARLARYGVPTLGATPADPSRTAGEAAGA